MLLGIDTGGTFTDFILWHKGRIVSHKVLSTPSAPEQAILTGIREMGLASPLTSANLSIVHGSTVATNATLEGKGASTVYITNRGFKDILAIGRQTRRELYNLTPPKPPASLPDLTLETGGRLNAEGDTIETLTQEDLATLCRQIEAQKPEAVAINLLFSFLDDRYEKQIAEALPKSVFISRSSDVLPEQNEYERGIATWLNARLGPLLHSYLTRLKTCVAPTPVAVMQSSGGTIDAELASQRAVNLLLSGPAGGLAAAQFIGKITGINKLMTFDMGGTSTDVSLIDGQLNITTEGTLGPYPIAVPMVDMHTIGAGGGSIAKIDEGSSLRVGPASAGADPGPACYGKGGQAATVTDANTVLGRLLPENFLGGQMILDDNAAFHAVNRIATQLNLPIEEAANGIISVANENMAGALRVISIQRGHNPADFTLCSFGGAGGLHVCALAETLQMERALVPSFSGVLSALGMAVAPRERQLTHAHRHRFDTLTDEKLQLWFKSLYKKGEQALLQEGAELGNIKFAFSTELRYTGQTYTLNVDWSTVAETMERFHKLHAQRYGHAMALPIELTSIRARIYCEPADITLPTPGATGMPKPSFTPVYSIGKTPVFNRDQLPQHACIEGPALICETVSTTFIAPKWKAIVDEFGNLRLQKSPAK